MGKLCQEFRLQVIFVVRIALGQVNLQACVRGGGANLRRKRSNFAISSLIVAQRTHTLALRLIVNGVERAKRHFFKDEVLVEGEGFEIF